jgi:hypothetical protein
MKVTGITKITTESTDITARDTIAITKARLVLLAVNWRDQDLRLAFVRVRLYLSAIMPLE